MKTLLKIKRSTLAAMSLMLIAGILSIPKVFAQESSPEVTDATVAVTETLVEVAPAAEASAIDTLADLACSLDTVWMLLAAMLVFFMQPGFALVEAGFTRAKNTANILTKNFVDFITGSLLFFFTGFGIMFAAGGFMGTPNLFDLSFFDNGLPVEGFLIFQTVFAATAATIVSGAMAERTKFSMYLIYTIFISGIIYPISGHWTWGGGFLMAEGGWLERITGSAFHDFAGSTVVHSVGGWIALAGAMILGPRLGKYGKDGKSKAIPGHNLTIASLGVFILWFGWFGFNPGSQLGASGDSRIAISHVFLTTNLAACGGGLAALLTAWARYKKPSLSLTLNGLLAGLVAITAGCDLVSPVGAIVIGILAGILMVFSVEFIDRILKIDDPVGASSVHGVCGFLGTLMTGLFAVEGGVLYGGGGSLFCLVILYGQINLDSNKKQALRFKIVSRGKSVAARRLLLRQGILHKKVRQTVGLPDLSKIDSALF